eukprot:541625-Karenia_brevis.AAC.1
MPFQFATTPSLPQGNPPGHPKELSPRAAPQSSPPGHPHRVLPRALISSPSQCTPAVCSDKCPKT